MRSSRLLVLIGVSTLLAACGGALESEPLSSSNEIEQASASREPSTPPSSQSASSPDAPSSPPATSSVIPPGEELPTTGACAERKTSPGRIGGAAPGIKCNVRNATTEAGTGFVSIAAVEGDLGDAAMTDGTLLLRCATADKMLFQAAIRCFEGNGDYTVAPGDIVLGGELSDRACRLAIDIDASAVRGFIECPNAPEDPDNVFASSGAPIGLGHFDLTRTF